MSRESRGLLPCRRVGGEDELGTVWLDRHFPGRIRLLHLVSLCCQGVLGSREEIWGSQQRSLPHASMPFAMHTLVLPSLLPSCQTRREQPPDSGRVKAKPQGVAPVSHSALVNSEGTEALSAFPTWSLVERSTDRTDSEFNHTNLFLVIKFHSQLSQRVRITHYFFTQRVCLLLLVFISINLVSAGLTQITTSMSCTFDLKIKLIWEVFKALLIFIWPLAVAMFLTGFFLKLEILLPLLSLGCSIPIVTTLFFTFCLGTKWNFT